MTSFRRVSKCGPTFVKKTRSTAQSNLVSVKEFIPKKLSLQTNEDKIKHCSLWHPFKALIENGRFGIGSAIC